MAFRLILTGDKKVAKTLVLDKSADLHAGFLEERITRISEAVLVEGIVRMTHDQNTLKGIQLNHGVLVVLEERLFLGVGLGLIVAMREHVLTAIAHGPVRTVIRIVGTRDTHLSVHTKIQIHF